MLLTNAWTRHERLVRSLARYHASRHHTDPDDTMAEACYLFVDGVLSHDGFTSELSTWLTIKIRFGLSAWSRRERLLKSRAGELPEDVEDRKSRFSLPEWLGELSRDARTVARVLLESPYEIIDTAASDCRTRVALKRFLRESGWDKDSVRRAFAELEASL